MDLLRTRPARPCATLLLAHGAGGSAGTPFLGRLSDLLGEHDVAVARFTSAYRVAGRPPPRAETLVGEFGEAVAAACREATGPLFVGGKSMGGRVATLWAGGDRTDHVSGVVVFGYPFHPPGKDEWRLDPLARSRRPVFIVQGDRDPFGSRGEVERHDLPPHVEARWIAGGDHDLKTPRGHRPNSSEALAEAAGAAAAWMRSRGR